MEAASAAWRRLWSLPVHLARNSTARDEITVFSKQTEKGGAEHKAQFKSRFRCNHDLTELIDLDDVQRAQLIFNCICPIAHPLFGLDFCLPPIFWKVFKADFTHDVNVNFLLKGHGSGRLGGSVG